MRVYRDPTQKSIPFIRPLIATLWCATSIRDGVYFALAVVATCNAEFATVRCTLHRQPLLQLLPHWPPSSVCNKPGQAERLKNKHNTKSYHDSDIMIIETLLCSFPHIFDFLKIFSGLLATSRRSIRDSSRTVFLGVLSQTNFFQGSSKK